MHDIVLINDIPIIRLDRNAVANDAGASRYGRDTANHLSSSGITSGLRKGLITGEGFDHSRIEQRAVRRAERQTLLAEKVIGDRDPMVRIGNDEIMTGTCIVP
ncbi:hypothetical protein [Bradyrhizobium sp. WSM2793]|uniref:hypothetical protein n=2 Tax=Bradyrhizobium TaxID=374 RepID=UPI0004757913|nr:hypothetical protein [Bradyrhizobium sp. WSM2793]